MFIPIPEQLAALATVNEFLAQHSISPLQEAEIRDWNITGFETTEELKQLAHDLVSEEHSNKCENNFWAKHDWQQD